MSLHDVKNLVYFVDDNKDTKKDLLSEEQLDKILDVLAKQAIKAKTSEELESAIQYSLKSEQQSGNTQDVEHAISFIKILQNLGYIRDKKNWLTNKGFFEIGNRILHEIMKNLDSFELGLHETHHYGDGNIVIDTTKKYEIGDDIKHLNVSSTILNSIQRLSRTHSKITFPILMNTDDLEEFETIQDVKAAIVYCIDLSSTMKVIISNNISRIEAAKKTLWALYMLNKKFFPNDEVFIVGFASLASQINPSDIPFLKTYDSNDNFFHYTNYQSALKLSRKILQKNTAQNKRIVLITDGQPSACFVENESQKNDILYEKPYSNFYLPEENTIFKIQQQRNLKLDINPDSLIYLCYMYKKVDPKIKKRTIIEAKKCIKDGIKIDSLVVGDENELLDYIIKFEKELKGKTYHMKHENMDKILVTDYLTNTRKVFSKKPNW